MDINEKIQEEIDFLENEELYELESLITDGANAKIPVTLEIPLIDGSVKKFGAMIRPLTNLEWNNANRKSWKNKKTTPEIEICKIGLYDKNGNRFKDGIIEKFPAGVITKLVKEISRISGVELNSTDTKELMRELMGF